MQLTDKDLKKQKSNYGRLDFSLFTKNSLNVLENAAKLVTVVHRKIIKPKHLLVALLLTRDTAAYNLLVKRLKLPNYSLARDILKRKPEKFIDVNKKDIQDIVIGKEVKEIMLEASHIASRSGAFYIGTEHLLMAVLLYGKKTKDKFINEILKEISDLEGFVTSVTTLSSGPFAMLKGGMPKKAMNVPINTDHTISEEKSFSFLKDFTIDIRHWFNVNTLGILYERTKYSDEVLKGLIDPFQGSVLIIGESGVGKTYLVYEIAERLAKLDVPISLKNATIRSVNMSQIVASAKFPSDVEKRVMGVLNEAYDNPDVILFFDDFQYLISTILRGGINMRMTLRRMLDSNRLKVIAAMPASDYDSLIAQQEDIGRLFKTIELPEPDMEENIKIIEQYVDYLKNKFPLKITREAVATILKLTDEYLIDEYFPQKSIKVLGALVSEKLFKYQSGLKKIGVIEKKISDIELVKSKYIDIHDFDQAKEAQNFQAELKNTLEKMKDNIESLKDKTFRIDVKDVKNLLSRWIKIPVETLSSDETSMLLNLEKVLKKYIVSQQEAVRKVSYAVKRGRLGISASSRPWASFLFLGPTGVGKTELAKVLAKHLFGDTKERLVQVDMSEFMEKHSVSKLIGSPPGYVGFEQGGMLTERIKENPYSVVLFDEIEKAAPDVLNLLLQILEEGHLTDSKGDTVSFKNTIIILTSNIGADKIFEDRILGFYREEASREDLSDAYDNMQEELTRELKKKLRPELLNRIDDIIIFKSLTRKDGRKILDILLNELNMRLLDIGLQVGLTSKAKRFLLDKGFNQEYGARPLRRSLQHHVEDVVADFLLKRHSLYKSLKRSNPKVLTLDYNSKQKQLYVESENV